MNKRFQDPFVWLDGRTSATAALWPGLDPTDSDLDGEADEDAAATDRPATTAAANARRGKSKKQHFRTIWISDVHLGMPGTRVQMLHDFLKHTDSDNLFLVGDIVDLWKLRHGWHWPTINNSIVRRMVKKAKRGTKVVYIPGNHDDLLRQYLGMQFGDIVLQAHAYHTTADGRRFLILHGDEFDTIVRHHRVLSMLGGEAYSLSLAINRWINACRRRLSLPYWSLSAFLKHKVKNAMALISNYEQAVVHAARESGVDGVICGHIHHAAMRDIDGITYCNTGDWVESCTALVEHLDGRLEIIDWSTQPQAVARAAMSDPSDLDLDADRPDLPAAKSFGKKSRKEEYAHAHCDR